MMRGAIAFIALIFTFATPAAAADDAELRDILATAFPKDTEMALALTGAPEHLRAGATVYVFDKDGYSKAREGTNGFTCLLNRDASFYGSSVFKPTCWDPEGVMSYVPVMLHVGRLLAQGKTTAEMKSDVEAGFHDGRFHRPQRTGIAYMLAGDITLDRKTAETVRTNFPGHYMIYAPGVASADIGYSSEAAKADRSLPFIFSAGAGGTELAYLITVPHHP